jgi:glycerophosphoryl diester phosphodiesterase
MNLRRGARGVLRVGHRGAAALAPENSLAAIEAATVHGLDGVELDVSRAVDGTLVLAHGPSVPPDAAPLDAGLALVSERGLFVQVDVKVQGVHPEVVAALRRHDLLERAFVSSFSLPILAAFAAEAPALPRSFTYPEDRYGLSGRRALRPAVAGGLAALRAALPRRLPRRLRSVDAAAATLNWTVVSPAAIAACHGLGAAVYVWTVNDAELARGLSKMGVDGIISDDPGIFLSW